MSDVIRDREIKILEFNLIREKLAELTVSPMAAARVEILLPSGNYAEVARWHKETAEGRRLCSKNAFNPEAVEDPQNSIIRSQKGAILSSRDLAALMGFLKAAKRWIVFFKDSEQVYEYPIMAEMAQLIDPCPALLSELDRSIDPEGLVLDSASDKLRDLRRRISALQNRIRDKLEEYIRGANTRKYLQEPLVTIRGGRYVLPVKQEYKQHMAGVVHDQSASGATLFIEPMPVLQMQNELTAFQRSEEQEIERILYKLSSLVSDAAETLFQTRLLYGELDLIVARGRYALLIEGSEPDLVHDQYSGVALKEALHPLLSGDKVPLNVEIGRPVRTLVITGPNTGGKTVALKTIGLLAVMAQCGLQIPAERGSKLAVFKQIRADIGDEQSIAQSLSTFSGHMKNIIEIISGAGRESLLLFDELGAGTDPSEGSALAMAILEEVDERGALTVATTHSNELKLFAQVRDSMQNAAMEFDSDTLSPTYRLLQGVPGQSNAFYIAEQLGLTETILLKAKSFLHRSHDQVESVIASLVEDQQRYHRDSRQAALERGRAEALIAELERERDLLRARREDILKEAREQARQMIRQTKKSTDQLYKEFVALRSNAQAASSGRVEELRREVSKIKDELNDYDQPYEDEGETLSADLLKVGLPVLINSLNQQGEVLAYNESDVQVQVGTMKISVPLSDLVVIKTRKNDLKNDIPRPGGYTVTKDTAISREVDLRGMNFEEAVPLVDKLLDNALWAGLNSVDLIHGKGTGKLKERLRFYLKSHPLVKSMRSGGPAEGGEGVTVVTIRG